MNRIVKIDKKINDDIIVNCVCFCKKYFLYCEKLLYILPCCHIIHETCFNKHILDKQYNNITNSTLLLECPFCNGKISSILNENKIKKNRRYNQYYIDIKSVKIFNGGYINYMSLPLSIVKFTSLINKLILIENQSEIIDVLEYVFNSFNIKINIIDNTVKNGFIIKNNSIEWKNKKDNDAKTVIISNHSNYLDSLILYYIFRCGFVAGDFINNIEIGKIISTKCKLLIFKRGVDTNMVEKIKEYLNEMKKIVIFPEGKIGNNNTLSKFRTGAFHTNANICPVVIKYKNYIHDDDFKQFIFKIITQSEIIVDIYINDIFYPPFNNEKIENIRNYMAEVGNLQKSRVSNKSLHE